MEMSNDNADMLKSVKFPQEENLGHSSAVAGPKQLVKAHHTVVDVNEYPQQKKKQSSLSASGTKLLSPKSKEVTRSQCRYLLCHNGIYLFTGLLLLLFCGYIFYSETRFNRLEARLENVEQQLKTYQLAELEPHHSRHHYHGGQHSDVNGDYDVIRARKTRHLPATTSSKTTNNRLSGGRKTGSSTFSRILLNNTAPNPNTAPQLPQESPPYVLHVTPVKNQNLSSSVKSRDYIWEPSSWSTKEMSDAFERKNGGSAVIRQAGVYLIYSHSIVHVGAADSGIKFELKRAADQGQGLGQEEVIAQCMQNQHANNSERVYSTCSLVTVAYLQAGDRLRFDDAHCMSPEGYSCRQVRSEAYSFYWGLVKLSSR